MEEASEAPITNAVRTELARALDIPYELAPDKRPLVISQPASNRWQWAVQELRRNYPLSGHTNALWDAPVDKLFLEFATYSRTSPTNEAALLEALDAVVQTGCTDPMVQYMTIRYSEDGLSPEERAVRLLRAHEGLLRSEYHPVFKFTAGWRAVQSTRKTDRQSRRDDRLVRITLSLEDLARDTNAPPEEVFDLADAWVNHTATRTWPEYVLHDLFPLMEKNFGHAPQWPLFAGRMEIKLAWGARGSGLAHTVSEEEFKKFQEHLARAEQHLERAWQMTPDNPEICHHMLMVELGQGQGRARAELWFHRAMELNPNDYTAVNRMAYYLEPKWYGSEGEALAFARRCVASTTWGGHVPLVLADTHRKLARYRGETNAPAYWRQPHVWRDIKFSYDKFFQLNPDAVAVRHDYARDAFDCGQHRIFLQQVALFTTGTNHDFFGGRERFDVMIQEANQSR